MCFFFFLNDTLGINKFIPYPPTPVTRAARNPEGENKNKIKKKRTEQ